MKHALLATTITLMLFGCTPTKIESTDQTTSQASTQQTITLSNLSDETSRKQMRDTLVQYLDPSSVDTVMAWIQDYNTTIENTSLTDGFVNSEQPNYDVVQIDKLWQAKKGWFIGTNCRLNTFMLLKNTIKIGTNTPADDRLLFLDREAVETGKLLNAQELQQFNQLFARVATDATTDVTVHAKKMQAQFANIRLDDTATMLSVVMHDNLDGDYLFIGHVGVLVPAKTGYLFLEKLSFQEPYQAIQFASKDAAYDYLLNKYAIDYNQPTAQPFIMENDKLVRWVKDST
ncbi:protein of unknown function [Moraxella cuniculi DSM 21768]|uniref:DUF4300 domain-containing protein n=1 Tax=Moraxella cuniculi DSM 21768 TaxID=1122245 RepID=A0A1N7E1W3_9GAMM|nr:DUF4300 family protein [Moraxella cuniculi]OOS04616.1 hypothetical protein B0189_08095 [Moraxella cuniculi]SIR82041.1 protein of unknown function [Moraxella cuniculi DSM 21768]